MDQNKMIEHLTEKEKKARKRNCLALDNLESVYQGIELSKEQSPFFGIVKVGKELNQIAVNEGVNIIRAIYEQGTEVFLDLKLHDTPNTVFRAAYQCSVPGVRMFNAHISGAESMCKKAIEGSYKGAEYFRTERPKVIGVTELTSLNDDDLKVQRLDIKYNDLVRRRTELAKKWGLDGVICPARIAGSLEKEFGSDFLYVTPGIEWKGKKGEGQKQLYTPDMAIRDCSNSILVIGSAVTGAENRRETAYEILQAMAREI